MLTEVSDILKIILKSKRVLNMFKSQSCLCSNGSGGTRKQNVGGLTGKCPQTTFKHVLRAIPNNQHFFEHQIIGQNVQNRSIVLINNSRTACPTEILMTF